LLIASSVSWLRPSVSSRPVCVCVRVCVRVCGGGVGGWHTQADRVGCRQVCVCPWLCAPPAVQAATPLIANTCSSHSPQPRTRARGRLQRVGPVAHAPHDLAQLLAHVVKRARLARQLLLDVLRGKQRLQGHPGALHLSGCMCVCGGGGGGARGKGRAQCGAWGGPLGGAAGTCASHSHTWMIHMRSHALQVCSRA
jgi:hypothetical protein